MNFTTKIGPFNMESGGGIFPTFQESRMVFCSRKSQVRTLPGKTAKSEAQSRIATVRLLTLWFYFRVAPSVTKNNTGLLSNLLCVVIW